MAPRALILGLLLGGAALAQEPTPADRLWKRALDATAAGAFDQGRAMMDAFARTYSNDSRALEARRRASDNAFLSRVAWCASGRADNRIDLGMSADGLLSTQEDQEALRRIVVNSFESAMILRPFDVYWNYFNWHIVHAGSRRRGRNPRAAKEEYDTCFGGMAGWKHGTDADACVDFDLVRKRFHPEHVPDLDFFLIHVRGGNGWAMDPFGAVGTCHFRYVPRMLGDGRLRDGEICGNGLPFPRLKERFAQKWQAFQEGLARQRAKMGELSVREWRKLTASMKRLAFEAGTAGEFRVAANEVSDRRPHPDVKLEDRPFPEFETLPWYPWLLKGDPTVTASPTMVTNIPYTTVRDFVLKPNGELELALQNNPDQKAAVMKEYGGRMPTERELRERVFLGFFSHSKCFLGGCNGPQDMSPQCCSACLEQAVLGIYRRVNPIDEFEPRLEELEGAGPHRFVLTVLKPLDHYLTVEWRVDGKLVKSGTERTLVNGQGKPLGGVPAWKAGRRTKAYFEPEEADRAPAAIVASVMAQREVRARHALTLGALGPGEHRIEATVIDETPWVLHDPDNLLTRRHEWKVVVR